LLVALAATGTAQAAMVCARPRSDGTFSTTLKLREACKPNEVEIGIVTLQPLRLFGPTSTSVTSTSTSSTTSTTTLDQHLALSDPMLGLMIELKRNQDGVTNYADPHDLDNLYTWTDSGDADDTDPDGTMWTDFLVKLNTPPCFAGHCDWRQAQQFADRGDTPPFTYPLPPPHNFPQWSSESDPSIPSIAQMAGASEPDSDFKTAAHAARAVRDLP
jgi:hypothetical protein